MIHSSKFFDNFGQVLNKYPNIDLTDMFSKGQMDSKRWLIDTLLDLELELGTVFVCAGWYGSLSMFMLESDLKIDKIRSFDIDDTCASIAETFNRSWVMENWKFKATTMDIMDMTYPLVYRTMRANGTHVDLVEMPDTVINTSSEHISKFSEWFSNIPKGTTVVIQGNNFYEIEDHVNTSDSLDEFDAKSPMSKTLYLGELELPKYTRFMKIGIK